jgi:hydrogen peroxide-dependent heme synthase
VLHLFCKVGPLADGDAVAAAVKAAEADDVQVVPAAMLGHKADVAVMALAADLWRLRQLQTELVAAGLEVVDSYVSLTELSEYAQGVPEEMRQARLHPQVPPEGKPAFCFYPMSKRRGEVSNWFTLPYDRKELMTPTEPAAASSQAASCR